MALRTIGLSALAFALMSSVATAATVGFTEGVRDQVAGTTLVTPTDASNSPPGFDLTASGFLGSGIAENRSIDLHGRIVGAIDVFEFTATREFEISFIFGGYDLEAGGTVTESGFVREGNSGSNSSIFTLTDINTLTSVTTTPSPLVTDIIAGDPFLFAAGPGSYRISLDGQGQSALYDLRLTAVPLPAALPLFAGALGLFGLLGWRRKKSGTA